MTASGGVAAAAAYLSNGNGGMKIKRRRPSKMATLSYMAINRRRQQRRSPYENSNNLSGWQLAASGISYEAGGVAAAWRYNSEYQK